MSREDSIQMSFDAPEITEEDRKAAARLAACPDAEILCDEENPPMPENVFFRKGLCPPSQKKGRRGTHKGAGRKPALSSLIPKTIRLPQEVWDKLS